MLMAVNNLRLFASSASSTHMAEEVYTKIDVPAAAAASNKNFAHKIALLHDANS